MPLVLSFLIHAVGLKGSRQEIGSPTGMQDRSKDMGTAQSSNAGAGIQRSLAPTWMFVEVVEDVAMVDIRTSSTNACGRSYQRGLAPQRRACHHWAMHWQCALQNGRPNPMPSESVLDRWRTCIETGLVPNMIAAGGAGRVLIRFGLRANGPYQLGKMSVLGDGNTGVVSRGSTASQPVSRCDSTTYLRGTCPRRPTAAHSRLLYHHHHL